MDPTDICPNCGAFFSGGEDHRCLLDEEAMNYQTDDNKESSPFVEKVMKESNRYDESATSNIPFHLRSLEINPFIEEGNQLSTPHEERDAFEASWASASENAPGFLSVDTTLYSDQAVTIVSQPGNPLDGLPFDPLVTSNLSDSNRKKDKKAKSKLISKRRNTNDAVAAKTISSVRLDKQNIFKETSKGDCSSSNLSQLLEKDENQNISEEAPVSSASGGQTSPSRLNLSEHSQLNPIKHSPQKLFTCSECGMVFLVKDSYVEHLLMYDHQTPSEGTSGPSPSSSQAGPSVRPDRSGLSETGSKKSLWEQAPKQQTFLCSQCGNTFSCKKTYDNHFFVQTKPRSFECKDCTRNFALKLYLESHSRRHTADAADRTFVCRTCGRPFICRSNLCRHRRSHTQ